MIAARLVRLASIALSTVDKPRPYVAPDVLAEMTHLARLARSVPGRQHEALRAAGARIATALLSIQEVDPSCGALLRCRARQLHRYALSAYGAETMPSIEIPPAPCRGTRDLILASFGGRPAAGVMA